MTTRKPYKPSCDFLVASYVKPFISKLPTTPAQPPITLRYPLAFSSDQIRYLWAKALRPLNLNQAFRFEFSTEYSARLVTISCKVDTSTFQDEAPKFFVPSIVERPAPINVEAPEMPPPIDVPEPYIPPPINVKAPSIPPPIDVEQAERVQALRRAQAPSRFTFGTLNKTGYAERAGLKPLENDDLSTLSKFGQPEGAASSPADPTCDLPDDIEPEPEDPLLDALDDTLDGAQAPTQNTLEDEPNE